MHLTYKLQNDELPMVKAKVPVFVVREDGQTIQKLEVKPRARGVMSPLFETTSVAYSKEEDSLALSKGLNNKDCAFNDLIKKLKEEPYNCNMFIEMVRTPWIYFNGGKHFNGPIVSCSDFNEMLKEIQAHNCEKRDIYSCDAPINSLLGFACKCGKKWQINLKALKDSQLNEKNKELITTSDSRKETANKLNDMSLFPDVKLNDSDELGNGSDPDSICCFKNTGLMGWNGSISDIEFIEYKPED